MMGKIKNLNEKGFGFIIGDDGKEYFFHHSGLSNWKFDQLKSGMSIAFDPTKTTKGFRAENIIVGD